MFTPLELPSEKQNTFSRSPSAQMPTLSLSLSSCRSADALFTLIIPKGCAFTLAKTVWIYISPEWYRGKNVITVT